MLIPVKCFTCGKVIADKYYKYKSEVVSRKQAVGIDPEKIQYLSAVSYTHLRAHETV